MIIIHLITHVSRISSKVLTDPFRSSIRRLVVLETVKLEDSAPDNQTRFKNLEDAIWMMSEEVHSYVISSNGQVMERIIESSVPKSTLDEHLNRYKFALPHVKNKNILDMACGTGYGTNHLQRYGGISSALGIDFDPIAVRYAQLKYSSNLVSFVQGDACTKCTSQVFETIISFETIEHVPDPDAMLTNITQMLVADGTFLVSTPIRQNGSLADKPANQFHIREWNQEEFNKLLNKHFDEVEMFGQIFPLIDRFGFIPLRFNTVTAIMKLIGSYKHLYTGFSEVKRFEDRFKPWLKETPIYMVAVCKKPRK